MFQTESFFVDSSQFRNFFPQTDSRSENVQKSGQFLTVDRRILSLPDFYETSDQLLFPRPMSPSENGCRNRNFSMVMKRSKYMLSRHILHVKPLSRK